MGYMRGAFGGSTAGAVDKQHTKGVEALVADKSCRFRGVEAFERSKPDGSTLRWRLAYRHFTRLQQGAGSGIVPFLIEWESASPAAAAPGGIELVGLRAEARDLAAVERSLRCLDIAPADLQLQRGEEDRLFAMLRTPKGIIEF